MKQRLIKLARNVFRALPIAMARREQVKDWAFSNLPQLFSHLPEFQLWSIRHPETTKRVFPFDALADSRKEILEKGYFDAGKDGFLMVSHGAGGGTETHVQALAEKLEAEEISTWVLRGAGHSLVRLERRHEDGPGLVYDRDIEFAALVDQLKTMRIIHLHVHHLMEFGNGAQEWIIRLKQSLGIDFDYTMHDYFAICPRYTLFDEAVGGYCGEPDVKRCTGCVRTFSSVAGREVDMPAWRADWADFLNQARSVFVPDPDVEQRMGRYLPQANLVLRPHWVDESLSVQRPQFSVRNEGQRLRIVTLGAIGPHKGSMVLYRCAKDAKERNLPIEFTLIGFSDIDYMLKRVMKVTGEYKPEDLPNLLAEAGFHAAFLPAVWPEAFSYTLSELLGFGLYPVSFDIGAIGRRIVELGYGTVLDYNLYRNPSAINDALLAIELPESVPAESIQESQTRYPAMLTDYYETDPSSDLFLKKL